MQPVGYNRLLAAAIALSGFAALAYQIVWQRVLTQVIGSDFVSVALIVSIFMACLGAGSEIARRALPAIGARAPLAYALIEIAIGAYGAISIPLLRNVNAFFAQFGSQSIFSDALLQLVLLAPPIIGMGMTAPLIVEAAKNALEDLGERAGLYYGLNVAGAAIGTLATGLLLIELFGLSGVARLAAGVNVLIGAAVFIALRGVAGAPKASDGPAEPAPAKPSAPPDFRAYYVAAILFGFGTLALQAVYFRVLSNYFTMSVIVFPAVLAAYLALMAIGQIAGGRLADRFSGRIEALIACLFALGAALLILSLRFPPEWAASIGALVFSSFSGQLVADSHPHLIGDPSPSIVLAYSFAFMVAVAAWSALFPAMVRLATTNIAAAGRRFAAIYSLYSLGNVAGAFATGLVLFSAVGTAGAAGAAIIIVGFGAALLALRDRGALAKTACFAGLLCAAAPPANFYKTFRLGDYRVAEVVEGATGVVSVTPTERFYTIIDMNRTASASALKSDPGPGDQYEAWRWNHSELFALDPEFRPRRILVIGLGHAYLIDALLDLPFVESITVVELSREIEQAVRKHTRTSAARIFADPRVEIVIGDGRRFVQSARARGERYDLIQNKINEPWHAGSGNLFTVEFFRAERDILTPGGYLGVRPLIGHAVDALEVFDRAIWPGYYHMYFKNGDFAAPKVARITPDIADAWNRALPSHPPQGARRDPIRLALLPCCGVEGRVARNTDDRPTFEYDWLRRTYGRSLSPRTDLAALPLEAREVEVAYE